MRGTRASRQPASRRHSPGALRHAAGDTGQRRTNSLRPRSVEPRASPSRVAHSSERLPAGAATSKARILIRGGDLGSLRGDVRFPVASLETDPSMRPRELAEVFGAERSPKIIFEVDSVSQRKGGGDCLVHGAPDDERRDSRSQLRRPHSHSSGDRVITEGIDPSRSASVAYSPAATVRDAHGARNSLSFRAEFRRRSGHQTAFVRPGRGRQPLRNSLRARHSLACH